MATKKVAPARTWQIAIIVSNALALSLIGACSGPEHVHHASHEHRVVAEGSSVTVTNVSDDAHALPIAEEYCRSLGKTAVFTKMSQHVYRRSRSTSAEFSCVGKTPT